MYQQDLQQNSNGMNNNMAMPNYYQNAYQYRPQYQHPYSTSQTNYLKGRPVLSIEEAQASQIDLDGSVHVFTDIGNKKIYTKQFNMDGTATLKTYILMEDNESATTELKNQFVTKEEFNQLLFQFQNFLTKKENELEETPTKKPFKLDF